MPIDPFTAMAAATIGSSVIGGITSFLGQKDTNESNMELAQYQNEWNEKMYERQKEDNIAFWNMQNEYNSPKETMKRLVEAGINPRAQNGTSYANSGGINSPNAPMAAAYDYKSPLSAFSNLVGLAKQIQEVKILEAKANNLNEDTIYKSNLGAYTANRDADLLYNRYLSQHYNAVSYDDEGRMILPKSSYGVKSKMLIKDFNIKSEIYKQNKAAAAIAEQNEQLGIGNGDGDILSTILRMFMRAGVRNKDTFMNLFN